MLVLTPNPCFDRTLWVEQFAVGAVARPHRVEVTAGGKGVNVLRTAAAVGHPARLLVLLPHDQGEHWQELLAGEGLQASAVTVDGTVRSATIIVEADGRASVLNEPGATTDEADLDALLSALEAQLSAGETLVCSGSLPPGLPEDAYGRVVTLARAAGCETIVDGARGALARALPHRPDAVCPNLHEAEGLLSGAVLEPDDDAPRDAVRSRAVQAASWLHQQGVDHAVVTAGAAGAALADHDGERWFDAHPVHVVNPIGAGDSFVAALAAAHESGHSWDESVRHAVATAGAAVERDRAGEVLATRVAELLVDPTIAAEVVS